MFPPPTDWVRAGISALLRVCTGRIGMHGACPQGFGHTQSVDEYEYYRSRFGGIPGIRLCRIQQRLLHTQRATVEISKSLSLELPGGQRTGMRDIRRRARRDEISELRLRPQTVPVSQVCELPIRQRKRGRADGGPCGMRQRHGLHACLDRFLELALQVRVIRGDLEEVVEAGAGLVQRFNYPAECRAGQDAAKCMRLRHPAAASVVATVSLRCRRSRGT